MGWKPVEFRDGRVVDCEAPDWWSDTDEWSDARQAMDLEPMGRYGTEFADDVALYHRRNSDWFVAHVTVCDLILAVVIDGRANLLEFHDRYCRRREEDGLRERQTEALERIAKVLIAIGRHGTGRRITDDGEAEIDVELRQREIRAGRRAAE